MGSDGKRKIPRQADPEYVVVFYDDNTGEEHEVTIICSCDKNVKATGNLEYFYCEHCDRPCYRKNCETCNKYNLNVNLR